MCVAYGYFASAEFNLDILVEHARAAEKEKEEEEGKETKIPAIRLSQSSESQSGRTTPYAEGSLTSMPDQSYSPERELESERELHNRASSNGAALSAQGKVESGKLEAARTQYLKLKEERTRKITQRAQGATTLLVPSSQPSKTVTLSSESQKMAVTLQPKAHTPTSRAPPLTLVPARSGGYKSSMSSSSQRVVPSSQPADSRRVSGEQGSSVSAKKGQGTSAQSPTNPPKPTEKSGANKGGKNEGKTWKEKALQLRERSGQNAISILHKLQHQVHLTAVHATIAHLYHESVLFWRCGFEHSTLRIVAC